MRNLSAIEQARRVQGNNASGRARCHAPVSGHRHAQHTAPRQVRNRSQHSTWVRQATVAPLLVATLFIAPHLVTVANASTRPERPFPLSMGLSEPLATQQPAWSMTPFFGPELGTIWPSSAVAAEAQGETTAFHFLAELLSGYFSNPCTDPDADANGAWRATHPPGRSVPSTFTDIQQQQAQQMVTWLQSPRPPVSSGAEQALADTWASAQAASDGWAVFSPQVTTLDALADKADLEQYLCTGALLGRGGPVGIHRALGQYLLAAGANLPSASSEDLFALDDNHPDVHVHRARIATLLANTGLPQVQCASAAAVCHTMEKTMAQASMGLGKVSLAQAQHQAPAFAWATLWQTLGLDTSARVYVDLPAFQQMGTMLQTHALQDWKYFLRYQQAVQAEPFIVPPNDDGARIRQLDDPAVAGPALSAVYAQRCDPQRIEMAKDMLAALVAQFKEDVVHSALDAADRTRIRTALDTLHLQTVGEGGHQTWAGTSPTASYLANVQALRSSQAQRNAQALRNATASTPFSLQKSAHHLFAAANCVQAEVMVTQATINGLLDTFGDSPEGRWATLGSVLGHEIAHCLPVIGGLSTDATRVFERRAEAIRQRVENIQVNGLAVDAALVGEEVGCDLSGHSAARRAGMAEAEAEGRTFDEVLFFRVAAQLHAAHPTASQLATLLASDHPPPSVRAGLVREVEGFEAAHGCTPAPRAPFNRVI